MDTELQINNILCALINKSIIVEIQNSHFEVNILIIHYIEMVPSWKYLMFWHIYEFEKKRWQDYINSKNYDYPSMKRLHKRYRNEIPSQF